MLFAKNGRYRREYLGNLIIVLITNLDIKIRFRVTVRSLENIALDVERRFLNQITIRDFPLKEFGFLRIDDPVSALAVRAVLDLLGFEAAGPLKIQRQRNRIPHMFHIRQADDTRVIDWRVKGTPCHFDIHNLNILLTFLIGHHLTVAVQAGHLHVPLRPVQMEEYLLMVEVCRDQAPLHPRFLDHSINVFKANAERLGRVEFFLYPAQQRLGFFLIPPRAARGEKSNGQGQQREGRRTEQRRNGSCDGGLRHHRFSPYRVHRFSFLKDNAPPLENRAGGASKKLRNRLTARGIIPQVLLGNQQEETQKTKRKPKFLT